MYDEISLLESEGESESAWETSSEDEEGEEGCFLGLAPLNLDEAFASILQELASASEAEEPVASEPEVLCAPCGNECAICMDDIGASNCTVTECGHRFHSSCIFRNMMERIECPMCRKELVETPEDEDDDEDEDEDEDEDDEDDEDADANADDEDTEPESHVTCKQMADKLISLGYTPADLLFFAIGHRHSSETTRLTDDLDEKMTDLVDQMLDGQLAVDHRDGRSYAQVLTSHQSAEPKSLPISSQLQDALAE